MVVVVVVVVVIIVVVVMVVIIGHGDCNGADAILEGVVIVVIIVVVVVALPHAGPVALVVHVVVVVLSRRSGGERCDGKEGGEQHRLGARHCLPRRPRGVAVNAMDRWRWVLVASRRAARICTAAPELARGSRSLHCLCCVGYAAPFARAWNA